MDRISHLSDDVLLKILSFLQTKHVMRSMLLSKRFKSLWTFVPRLEFDDTTHFPKPKIVGALQPEYDYRIFREFVDRSLMSLEGQVLQSMYLKLRGEFTDGDVMLWVRNAVKHGLVELKLEYSQSYSRFLNGIFRFLPKSLYTACETLVVLKLENAGLDVPDLICLKSLKTLSLKSMVFSNPSSLLRLLPNCPVLEDLSIEEIPYNTGPDLIFEIIVPSLKRLYLKYARIRGLVIYAPSLKYLHIVDRSGVFSVSQNFNISEVVKAYIEVRLCQPEKLLHGLASVEHIHLCLSSASKVVSPVGISFHRLKHLEICSCISNWLDLFMHLLENSPSLKVIRITKCIHLGIRPLFLPKNQCIHLPKRRPHWNPPGSVPRCLSSNLETLEWIKYEGTQEQKELSTYILKNAVCLKKASFTSIITDPKKKLQMLQELSLSPRVSSTCELVFK